jgi:hypothetical protein
MKAPRKTVAVVVPLSTQPELTPEEEISLRHLDHHLAAYDRWLIAPPGLPAERAGYRVMRFPARFFGSMQAHARLLLSTRFYEAFSEYRYVLIHHTDALVLADRLGEWCEAGVDYVGAPWIRCADLPDLEDPRVGNGGFSLRDVRACLTVLRSRRLWADPEAHWRSRYGQAPAARRLLAFPRRYLKRLHPFNGARREIDLSLRGMPWFGDDMFFSDRGRHYHPEFRVASLEQGLRFAWDYDPPRCAEMTGGALPFGAHAWFKRGNRDFWAPHLMT